MRVERISTPFSIAMRSALMTSARGWIRRAASALSAATSTTMLGAMAVVLMGYDSPTVISNTNIGAANPSAAPRIGEVHHFPQASCVTERREVVARSRVARGAVGTGGVNDR